MDFALSEEQQELAGLAARILDDRMDLQHLKERDRSDDWYDLDTWREFAKANLLGIALPESAGGLGLGFFDLCMVLREVGRNVAPLPAIPTLVSAALPIARFGTDAQQAILAKVVAGDVLLTAALVEIRRRARRRRSRPRRATATVGVSTARRAAFPAASAAELVLVPARPIDGSVAVFLVPTSAPGVTLARQQVMNHEPLFELRLDGVRVGDDARLGAPTQGDEDPRGSR